MIYLASASPRRCELLEQLGLNYTQVIPEVDETPRPGEPPAAYVQRLALAKAEAGWDLLRVRRLTPAPVLGSDTAVVVRGRIYGKPADAEEAAAMLHSLSGSTHEVFTGVAVAQGEQRQTALNTNRVTFSPLDDARIAAYLASGEPFGKAGGYAIQGRAAAFISHLEGSYSGVVGLPLRETAELLAQFGVAV